MSANTKWDPVMQWRSTTRRCTEHAGMIAAPAAVYFPCVYWEMMLVMWNVLVPHRPPFPGHDMKLGQRLREDWFPILLDTASQRM